MISSLEGIYLMLSAVLLLFVWACHFLMYMKNIKITFFVSLIYVSLFLVNIYFFYTTEIFKCIDGMCGLFPGFVLLVFATLNFFLIGFPLLIFDKLKDQAQFKKRTLGYVFACYIGAIAGCILY